MIEELTKNGWKDLFPLVENFITWEINRVETEGKICSRFFRSLEELKAIYKKAAMMARFILPKKSAEVR